MCVAVCVGGALQDLGMWDVCYSSAPSSSLPFQQAQGQGRQGLAPGTGSILVLTRVLFTQYALPLPFIHSRPAPREAHNRVQCERHVLYDI